MSRSMAEYLDRTEAAHVDREAYERLLALVDPFGWRPMLSEPEPGMYRAWLRHMSGTRMFGRWATSATAAVEALITKVEPMAHGAVEGVRS